MDRPCAPIPRVVIINEHRTLDSDMGFEVTQADERRVVPVAVKAQESDGRLAKLSRERRKGIGEPAGVDEVFPFGEAERGDIGQELLLTDRTVVVVARTVRF